MQRNTITTAGELNMGDRFYIPTDRNKNPLQKVEGSQGSNHWCCPVKFLGNTFEKHQTKPIKENTRVIFLRSTTDAE